MIFLVLLIRLSLTTLPEINLIFSLISSASDFFIPLNENLESLARSFKTISKNIKLPSILVIFICTSSNKPCFQSL